MLTAEVIKNPNLKIHNTVHEERKQFPKKLIYQNDQQDATV
jgi:hypothetical protein